MSTIKVSSVADVWKSFGLSLVIGSALALSACSTPLPVKPAAATVAKPAPAAVNASSATTETQKTAAVSDSKATTETQTAAAAQPATAAKPMIMLHEDAKLGKMLVDEKGMALYIYDKDTMDKSNCEGGCLTKWPMLSATDAKEAIAAGDGVTAKLGVITRADGKFQVTADGMPLYYYASDKAAGDVTGQAVGNVWWVVGADGKKIGG